MAVNWRASVSAAGEGGDATNPTVQNSLTVPGGITNGAILAFFWISANGAITPPSAMTCNSQNMTQISRYTILANQEYLEMWGFLQSSAGWATGAQALSWNANYNLNAGSTYLQAACFDGVNQTSVAAAFTNAVTNTGSTAANSVSVTTAAGNAVAAMFAGLPANANYTVIGGGTPGQSIIIADDAIYGSGCEYQLINSGTSQNMTWTASTTGTWYGLGANIVAAPTLGTTTYHYNLGVNI